MTTASQPNRVDITPATSINSMLQDRVKRTGDGPMLERRETLDGPWLTVSAVTFDRHVTALARGFIARGVNVGDRVAIMSRTRYEWTVVDYALWAVGAVPVPIYETSAADQVEYILSDAEARLVVVEQAGHAQTVAEVRERLPHLEDVIVIDDGGLLALRDAGKDVDESAVVTRRDAVRSDDLATIIYTSGSTGRPKGAELTHGNFAHICLNARIVLPEVIEVPGSRTLLFLPIAHVFARLIQVAVLSSGSGVLGHAPDVKNLVADLGSFKPSFLLAVPRVFEKVYNSAQQKAAGSNLKRTIFHYAVRGAIAHSRAMDTGKESLSTKIAYRLGDVLVLKKLREAMGGNVDFAVSGGAPLGERLGHFFRGVGCTVLEGYGLTETTAPTAVNLPVSVAIGTVGFPMAGTSIRIEDDGEIALSGPHLFRAYHNQPELTAEVLRADDDGTVWFYTGDIGTLDHLGRLEITGRKKEIIVTAGGKNVAPALLEDRLRSHPLVSQVVVVGDQRPFIGALITLDAEMLPGWLHTHSQPNMTVDEAANSDFVLDHLQKAVDRANRPVSRAESIRKFTVLPTDFTEANGYLTPSMKIKRALITKDFAADIDALYSNDDRAKVEPKD